MAVYCTKCGAQIPGDSQFCPKCGAPVKMEARPEAESASAPAEQKGDAGHGSAAAGLVLGIVGVVFWFFGYGSFVSIVLGIIGLVLSGNARKAGNTEGIRTAGFVLSLIALIGGVIVFFCEMIALALVGASVKGLYKGLYDLLR